MRWLADENIHSAIVRELRTAGHDVVYAAEVSRQTSDHSLVEQAFSEGRIVLTEDKDFGEIVFRDRKPSAGVVLLRMSASHWSAKWASLLAVIAQHGEGLLMQYTVIDDGKVRSQPLERG